MSQNKKYNFKCIKCNYFTMKSSNYKRHLKSKKHASGEKPQIKIGKSAVSREHQNESFEPKTGVYICYKCEYTTTISSNYYRHKKSKKHLSRSKSGVSRAQKNEPTAQSPDESFQCPQCHYEFRHKQSLYNHNKKNRCKGHVTNNITNTTNNIDNSTNTIFNITFNINSKEEADTIKAILTKEKLFEICHPERSGLALQSYDIIKKIQSLSIETKKNNKELQNFKKTNFRDDIIDVLENNVFKKVNFKEYNREDLHKFAKHLMQKCQDIEPEKSYDEKLDLICDVLKDYDYYKTLPESHQHGTVNFIIAAIDECEKLSRLEHYNMTQKLEEEEEKVE